jgi:hypothetical protein
VTVYRHTAQDYLKKMAGRNQNKGAKAVTVSKREVGDKEVTKVVSRDDKYRQFCEGMRDLMQ